MKKIIPILILSLIILSPIFAESADATTVFLTSDNINGHDADFTRLNEIKERIESKTNGNINVVIDDSASNPGEVTRLMYSQEDVGVIIGGACAGSLVELADYSSRVTKKVIYVNAGTLDLNSINFLRRSYDDDFSDYTFASVKSPGKFLADAGVTLIQPAVVYPDDCHKGIIRFDNDEVNEYIANEIINAVYAETNANKQLDSDLIVRHKLNPKYLAEDSKKIVEGHGEDMKDSYGSYTTPQLLYMSSSYIAGYSLEVPQYFEAPDNPQKYSSFTRWHYSFNDYCNMADLVVDYMNEHGKAPDSINYKGATIGYYDLVYNFALLSEDDTSASDMNFPPKMEFHRYYSNFLYDLLPLGIIAIILITILLIIRKIIKMMKRRKQRKELKRKRTMYNRNPRTLYNNSDSRYYSDHGYPPNRPKRLNRQKRRRR